MYTVVARTPDLADTCTKTAIEYATLTVNVPEYQSFRPLLPESARNRATFDRNRPKLKPIWAACQMWPLPLRVCPKFVASSPNLAEFGPDLANTGPSMVSIPGNKWLCWSKLAEVRAIWGYLLTSRASLDFDRSRPNVSQNWPS